MRRALIGCVVTALAVLASAGAASAAPGQVTRVFRLNGTFAEAFWNATPTATSSISTFVDVGVGGSGLFVFQLADNTDASGVITSGTTTFADVTTGFSFSIDRGGLTAASLSASGVPATTCDLGAGGVISNCRPATIDVSADWTGQGPITRQTFNSHIKSAGMSVDGHQNGTSRAATATGTFSGSTLDPSDFVSGDLGFGNETVTVCIGNGCG